MRELDAADKLDAVDLLDRAVACIDRVRRQPAAHADPTDPAWPGDSARLDWAIKSVDDVSRRLLAKANDLDDNRR